VLCFGGYLTPAVGGEHLLGAHYRHDDENQEPSDSDTEEILTAATRAAPSLDFSTSHVRSARVCFRTSTVDRMPYIGRLPNFEEMKREADAYRSGTNIREKVKLRDYPGIYVNVGHGSRGLLSCPLGGEIIARLIHNEPLDSLQEAATLCEPARVPYRLLTPHP
jgi:tRNA 5-methylaminomethyl-2-thiouridine biosynthesis bifunctional protein